MGGKSLKIWDAQGIRGELQKTDMDEAGRERTFGGLSGWGIAISGGPGERKGVCFGG